jgi:hypothetical protein
LPRYSDNRYKNETIVTIAALFIMLLAAGVSLTTISVGNDIENNEYLLDESVDPVFEAERAALAGIKAAKGHIECHGIKARGNLPKRFYANGGSFEVAWGDINMADSTVRVMSRGYYEADDEKIYESKLESIINVKFLTAHDTQLLLNYYSHDSHYNHPDDTENKSETRGFGQ